MSARLLRRNCDHAEERGKPHPVGIIIRAHKTVGVEFPQQLRRSVYRDAEPPIDQSVPRAGRRPFCLARPKQVDGQHPEPCRASARPLLAALVEVLPIQGVYRARMLVQRAQPRSACRPDLCCAVLAAAGQPTAVWRDCYGPNRASVGERTQEHVGGPVRQRPVRLGGPGARFLPQGRQLKTLRTA